MKKVLLICPAIPDDMPYLKSYLDRLESLSIAYDITYICWDDNKKSYPKNYYAFNASVSFLTRNIIGKLYNYYKYSQFVTKKLSTENYTHIISMGIACSVFMYNILKKNFRRKYIYDIRDYSQILRFKIFRSLNKALLSNSYMNVISSEGFKQWLPEGIEYVVCHNTTFDVVRKIIKSANIIVPTKTIKVLTLGQIRDLNANTYVIESLANDSNYEIVFAGKGETLKILENQAKEKGVENAVFYGEYKKEIEDAIVEPTTFINVCMENNILSNYLLSNRLYLAARLKKPLISFADCYQAEIIKKYDLGVIIKRDENFKEKLQNYIASFNAEKFTIGCNNFLKMVLEDLQFYNKKMESFIRDN